MFKLFRKGKPKNPMVAALNLDNQTYARFIEDCFIDMDSNTRAHVLVAYLNLGPVLSATTRSYRKKGKEFSVEIFISNCAQLYEKAENEGDEINLRRFAWFQIASSLKRLEIFAEKEQIIAEIGAKIWLLIAQDAPILKIILPNNVVWQQSEKTWLDLLSNEDEIIQYTINHAMPSVIFEQKSVKEFARSKNLFYFRFYN